MRYWVYINNKVDGPYDETNLVTLEGFTPDTLICSEEVASNGGQEWVKASSVFEFDEVPVAEPAQQPAPAQQPVTQAKSDAQTQALLDKLEALTSGMFNLQSKLDSMQHNLDNALEQNKKLSDQVAQLSQPASNVPPVMAEANETRTNTITLTRHSLQEETTSQPTTFQEQAAPEEEEVIIRSALDSLYGGKPVEIEDTFQDLMPEKTAEQEARKKAEEEQAVHNIEPELEFIPLQEDKKTEPDLGTPTPQPQPAPAAAVQTDSEEAQPLPAEALDEIEKELTSISLQEDMQKAEPAPEASAPSIDLSLPQEEPAPQTEPMQEPAPEIKEALITTPGVEEAAKDALISELTASPKEDVLDQIIAEHQQEQTEKSHTGEVALGAAAAGLAAASLVSLVDKTQAAEPAMAIATDKDHPEKLEEVLPAAQMPEDAPVAQSEPEVPVADLPAIEQTPEVEQPQQAPQPQTTPEIPVADMPDQLPKPQEETEPTAPEIPVAQMPEELPQSVQEQTPVAAALPGLEEQPAIEAQAQQESAQPAEEWLEEETIEELVPNTQQQEPEGFYVKEEPALPEETPAQEQPAAQPEEQAPEETPAQEQPAAQPEEQAPEETPAQEQPAAQPEEETNKTSTITDKDLQDAFGNDDSEPIVESATVNAANEPMPEGNPNELTEIELKEGSTYLISDFVPPAQLTDNVADVMKANEEEKKDKKQETIFQDMLAATKSQSMKQLNTDGLPDDLFATQVNLENTIQAKRGATLDIKTVPMVPEPEDAKRLDVNELTDVNAQHSVKTSGGLTKSTKTVIMALVGLLLLIILYVLLGMMKLLPPAVNLFAGKPQAKADMQATQELLPEAQQQTPAPQATPQPALTAQAQEKVQNFPLPNGFLLKGFIEFKHPSIEPELITWETAEAVEADNYSVTVKVPPENPQNFKTVYRFNYNMLSGLLDPTVSDAKNLLDQAYGIKPAAETKTATTPAVTKQTAPAKKAAPRSTARKGTARKRTTN